jgi:hypothetical protein
MNRLRFIMRKAVDAADGKITYVRILQEEVEFYSSVGEFGTVLTREWHDVPCVMESNEPATRDPTAEAAPEKS